MSDSLLATGFVRTVFWAVGLTVIGPMTTLTWELRYDRARPAGLSPIAYRAETRGKDRIFVQMHRAVADHQSLLDSASRFASKEAGPVYVVQVLKSPTGHPTLNNPANPIDTRSRPTGQPVLLETSDGVRVIQVALEESGPEQVPCPLPEGMTMHPLDWLRYAMLHSQDFTVDEFERGLHGAPLLVMRMMETLACSELCPEEKEASAPGLEPADAVSDAKNRDDWVEALPQETAEENDQSGIERIRGGCEVVPLAVVEETELSVPEVRPAQLAMFRGRLAQERIVGESTPKLLD
jgi:hypothetical protein